MRKSSAIYRGRRQLLIALVAIVGLLTVSLTSRPPAAATPRVQGGVIEICGGQCAQETITFETGDLRLNKVDVVFLIDASGSMDEEIDEVQSQSMEIMGTLRALVEDAAFGAASFVDYNGFRDSQYDELYGSEDDYAYRLDQDITENTEDVQEALNQITLEYGNDTPESYSRALWEMQFLGWRENSKRIVIMFGDAYPHDRTFFGEDYGVDPGPDAVEGTADDLVFSDVVQDLIDSRITVIGVNSGYETDNAVTFFEYVAEQTSGMYFPLYNADEIPAAVAQTVEEEVSTIDRLTVRASRGYEDWIVVSPAQYTDISAFESNSFEVDICPVAGRAEAGRHDFELIVDGDGTVLEMIPIAIDYDPRCTTGAEVYIADSDRDDGSVCSEGPFWQSPDIINRLSDDGDRFHQNPMRGETNYIYARVHNIGDQEARQVQVTLYWANAATGLWYPDHWNAISSTTIDVVNVGEEAWTEAIPWTPPGEEGESHICLFARIESAEDPITREGDVPCDNNIAQRNLHVLDLEPGGEKSSDDMAFRVVGPPEYLMGVIDIVVAIPAVPEGTKVWVTMPSDLFARWQSAGGELEGGSAEGDRILVDPGAGEAVIHDLPLRPGEEAEVKLEIEAPVDRETEPFSVTVVERVDGRDVGGNTYYYTPPERTDFSQILDDPIGFVQDNLLLVGGVCCGGIFLVLLVVGGGFLILRRRRRAEPQPQPQPQYQPQPQPQPSPPPAPSAATKVVGKTCPECGGALSGDFAFCPHCGADLSEPAEPEPEPEPELRCPECGAELEEGAQFCTQCGAQV